MLVSERQKVVDLEFVTIERLDSGIIRSYYKYDVTLDIDKSKEVHEVVGKLTEGKASPQLFIACFGMDVTKETREWGACEESNKYTLASAIVCNSMAHRILGNFFIKVQKPVRPTRMFSNEEAATEWLLSFVN